MFILRRALIEYTYLEVVLSEQSDNNTGGPLRRVSAQINTNVSEFTRASISPRWILGITGGFGVQGTYAVSPRQTTSLFG